jgi:hypothetical protein
MSRLACRFAAASGLLLALAFTAPAWAQRLCSGLGEPSVGLDFNKPEPTLDTRRLVDMRTMSRAGLGEHEQALGLYKAELRTGLRIEYAMQAQGRLACIGIRRAVVVAEFTDRKIYMARELQPESCRHKVTLEHEREHARIDDMVLGNELPKVTEMIARAVREIGVVGPLAAENLDAYREDIKDRLERVFQGELDRIAQIRRREQSRIDTPESYKKEAERCPGGLTVR